MNQIQFETSKVFGVFILIPLLKEQVSNLEIEKSKLSNEMTFNYWVENECNN